ncbi:MAG: Rid family detoxifying hydrolase [Saprospiraceae bacterium]|nr:Rid family detoxifying hydrolase [Saprospiraceae bacterium]
MKTIINTENAPKPVGPYNQAVLSNNTLYLSGQIPINPEKGEILKGDINLQTHQVMKNLKAVLNKAGMDFINIVKATIFVKDISNFALINKAYSEYFGNEAPAREVAQVAALPLNAELMISMIAEK